MDVRIGSAAPREVFIELFDTPITGRTAAPVTVANFLNYIDDGSGNRRYDGSFVHRSAPGFVVQGGGFTFDPALGDFGLPASTPHIQTDAPIVNEFDASRSNLRGTIAMAKLANDPDSATSEWFFNLIDNSGNLDSQNGGFTVFGQVLGNGMDVVDAIAALNTSNQGGAFSTLPVADSYVSGDPITLSDLVSISTQASPYQVPLFVDPSPLDFELVGENSGRRDRTITLVNVGDTDLAFGNIGGADALAAPFSIVTDNCSNQALASFSSCTLVLGFEPTAVGDFQDSFDLPSDASGQPTVTVDVSGTGVVTNPVLEVSPASSVDYGDVALADAPGRQITLRNAGDGLLQPGTFAIAGTDAADFYIPAATDNCTGLQLAIGESCNLTVRFDANSLGARSAVLTVNASPDGQSVQLDLNANVVESQADLSLAEPRVHDFGDTRFDTPVTLDYEFGNQGTDNLIVTDISIEGDDAGEFTINNKENCVKAVAPNEVCQVNITFTPVGIGTKTATLRIFSSDADEGVADIAITATSSTDNDGVPDAIEKTGPNGGDANLDGTPDVQQENVASLPDINGNYVSLESDNGTRLVSVLAQQSPTPGATPNLRNGGSLNFRNGFFSFVIEDVAVGGSATVVLRLPAGQSASHYFQFGLLPSTLFFGSAQWYQFDYLNPATGNPIDGRTGAEFRGERVILHFVDGGRGDNDLSANGRIVDPGGPASLSLDGGSSSGGGGCSISTSTGSTRPAVDLALILMGLLAMRGLRGRHGVRAGH
ncbi:MAG: choice-of-anchor D domain-containing protein [Gammaproteobacteria bacterium]|jgi:cyclophilin family peptidyl-prolyl cis-trans isomerase